MGANLRDAKGLAQDQIEQAIGNETTQLPPRLKRPETWTKSIEEHLKNIYKRP
jgi:hypothetical protein